MKAGACRFLVALCMQLAAFAAFSQSNDRATRPGAPPAAASERRIALIIGNAAYPGAPLRNPVNDARDMAAALKGAGFQVTLRENIGLRAMAEAVRAFGDSMRADGVAVFYFAGHGVQVKDRNYLLPVDADIQREDEIPYATLDVNQVLDKMDRARSRVNVVILDACRNNPFVRSFRGLGQGLAQMEAPIGTLIAYATAPGKVALDGDGRNGIYTRHLLANINRAGLPAELMFKRVREGVTAETKGVQTPWESSSLRGDFAFVPQQQTAATPATPATRTEAFEAELAFWDAIKTSRAKADYDAYLQQYPKGHFAPLARARIAQLAGEVVAAAPPTTGPAPRPAMSQAVEPPQVDVAKPASKDGSKPLTPARPPEVAAISPAPPAASKPASTSKSFSEAAPNSSAIGFKLGDRFYGPGVLTVGWVGGKKQVVIPAGEWIALSAVDRDSGHAPPVKLITLVFGKFADDRLSAMITVTASRAGSNNISWADIDDCERPDPARLYEWKPAPSWQRQCVATVFQATPLPGDGGPVGRELRRSLQRLGASASGPAIVTTLLFAEKANGFMRIDRADWPAIALGNEVGTAPMWKTESLNPSTPRGAYVKALSTWVNGYRRAAEAGFRRDHAGADLVAGAAATPDPALTKVGEFDPAKVVAAR